MASALRQAGKDRSWASSVEALQRQCEATSHATLLPSSGCGGRSTLLGTATSSTVDHCETSIGRRTCYFHVPRLQSSLMDVFWHGCPVHHTAATTNAAFWQDKMQTNRVRDAETNRLLLEAGWQVIRIWEHEPVSQAVEKVTLALWTVMGPASGPQRTPRPGA